MKLNHSNGAFISCFAFDGVVASDTNGQHHRLFNIESTKTSAY